MNTSIDTAETNPSFSPNSFSPENEYNEIESITELLMDETLDQTLPDQKGNDEQGMLKKSVTFDFSLPEKKQKIIPDPAVASHPHLNGEQNQPHLPAGFTTLFTPPPDKA